MTKIAMGALIVVGTAAVLVVVAFLLVLYQGKRKPGGDPAYVAMGSSFAAGIGLGQRAPGSPIACMRTIGSYPQQISRSLNLPIMDVTCSAATTDHILRGGQYFQRAQINALKPETKLVTVTTGGNDIRYVGDLSFIAARNTASVSGWLMKRFWGGPLRADQRDYAAVRRDLVSVAREVSRRSPKALLIFVTYPTILPASGRCPLLNITQDEADMMRFVGEQLAGATRAAARQSGAVLVDMQKLGADHHACSQEPWVNGWRNAQGAQFHPTRLGTRATADAVVQAIRSHAPNLLSK
ncbi:SGNH/GDSL hydrolase family protein [Sphingomonas solaris]|uniref:SGNH/GDSL hydrolase family protein n=1 Tax=Alterirhizorhabdus solaris TaxID=2529389 RepID=A0A558R982_9SPHN|nr:SGNH/GDSL hydrolase family protein [Sphingomonas solaris]TVV75951.1 SGNH/GDSL hydrolase family protein [Sphingomonas solaris]